MPSRVKRYDPKPFQALLAKALEDNGENYRTVALATGLNPGTIGYWAKGKTCPTRTVCIILAEHFGIDPNDVLESAGYQRMSVLEAPDDSGSWGPEMSTLARGLQAIPLLARRELLEEVLTILDICIAQQGKTGAQ